MSGNKKEDKKEVVTNIEVTLAQVQEALYGLRELAQIKLPVKTAYQVGRIMKKLQKEYDIYEEARVKRIKELGTEQKDGSYKLPDGMFKSFNEEMEALLKEKVTVDAVPLKAEVLADIELSAAALLAMDCVIDGEF